MAVARITIKDLGTGDSEFSIEVDCYPRISDKDLEAGNLTLAQYVALKVVEFVKDGLEDVPTDLSVDITTSKKPRSGLH